MKCTFLPVIALLATAVTGCGATDVGGASSGADDGQSAGRAGSSAEPAGSEASSPCDLLSEAEVSAALGEQVKAELIDHGQPTGIRQCLWAAVSETELEQYQISIVRTEDMAQVWRDGGMTSAVMYEEQTAMGKNQPLPGIGDQAVLSGTQILALKDDQFISSGTLGGTSTKARNALLDLTTRAVNAL